MSKEEAIDYLDNYRKLYAELAPERFLEALDTLLSESQPPSNIDEAAEEYVSTLCDRADEGLRIDTTLEFAFKAGAEWQEEQDKETIKLAEDHAFLAGADWQKEQMMQEAVEGKVIDFRYVGEIDYASAKIVFTTIPKLKEGDKVRIIIVKEDNHE